MENIVPNFFDIQNLSNNTIVFSQTIGKDAKVIIKFQPIAENSIQLNVQLQKINTEKS